MLAVEENDPLTKIDYDALMAVLMRQRWTPVCLTEPPCGSKQLAGITCVSATPKGVWACWMSCARTARRRWSMAATKNAGCAVCITGGSSTWMAIAWSCRRNQKNQRCMARSNTGPIRRRNGAASSGRGWTRTAPQRTSNRTSLRPTWICRSLSSRSHPRQLGADHRRADCLGAFLVPALVRHEASLSQRRLG